MAYRRRWYASATLESIGAVDPGTPYADALVERLPAGEPLHPPLAEAALSRIGAEVATILARVHAAGAIVDGIRLELIYNGGRVTTLAPQGPAFIATAPPTKGIRTYHVPYFSPEQFLSRQSSACLGRIRALRDAALPWHGDASVR
jgi:hypothetical protein